MNYQEAREYIRSESGAGIQPGLTRIRRLLSDLGDPQEKKPVIHVAGTNGKGSVCACMEAILCKAGYSVGRFISPAVFGYREIIQVDGRWIGRQEFADCLGWIREAVYTDPCLREDRPTAFELETAAAYLYLAHSPADVLIIETGMGGLLDATNVVRSPLLCVITSIGMDHMHFLGGSIEEIAAQKAGIIVPGRPVVFCDSPKAAAAVIEAACRKVSSPYEIVETAKIRSADTSAVGQGIPESQHFDYGRLRGLELPLLGSYEALNASLAVQACLALRKAGEGAGFPEIAVTQEAVRAGLKKVRWPGRFEVLQKQKPVVVLDGAHNPDGARVLRESVLRYFPGYRIILVMAVFRDKDYPLILEIMSSLSETIVVFRPPGLRGLEERELAESARKYFPEVVTARSCEQAVEKAARLAGGRTGDERPVAVIQFGTLSTAARCRKLWLERPAEKS